MIGMPVEWLGPLCEECEAHHEVSEPHRVLLTAHDLERIREMWKSGILPDKTVGR